jgi:hypothetical protein
VRDGTAPELEDGNRGRRDERNAETPADGHNA